MFSLYPAQLKALRPRLSVRAWVQIFFLPDILQTLLFSCLLPVPFVVPQFFSSPVTIAPGTSASISTPPICSVSPSRSSPITSVRQHDGARLAAGNLFPFRPDRSDDYLYLYFLYHAVNSSHSTPELQQRLLCMEASFRSYLVAHGYPQALEASVGDLLLSHFVHVINLVGDRDRNLPLPYI